MSVMVNNVDKAYLDLASDILEHGTVQRDRTGTGTLSCFGRQLRYDLTQGFAVLTTKRVPFKTAVAELKWFLSGCTDNKVLQDLGVKIWNGNSPENGDLGPIYGHNWRYFGAKYIDCHTDYTGQGVDQIRKVLAILKDLKKNGEHPESRRMIVNAWDPCSLEEAALPPCHAFWQLYWCQETNELSLHLYQRSADLFLGVPFNITSYAVLLSVIAKMFDMIPKDLVHSFGDVHIYLDHIEQVKTQLTREPRTLPKLVIGEIRSIEDFDVSLEEYDPHPTIRGNMSV